MREKQYGSRIIPVGGDHFVPPVVSGVQIDSSRRTIGDAVTAVEAHSRAAKASEQAAEERTMMDNYHKDGYFRLPEEEGLPDYTKSRQSEITVEVDLDQIFSPQTENPADLPIPGAHIADAVAARNVEEIPGTYVPLDDGRADTMAAVDDLHNRDTRLIPRSELGGALAEARTQRLMQDSDITPEDIVAGVRVNAVLSEIPRETTYESATTQVMDAAELAGIEYASLTRSDRLLGASLLQDYAKISEQAASALASQGDLTAVREKITASISVAKQYGDILTQTPERQGIFNKMMCRFEALLNAVNVVEKIRQIGLSKSSEIVARLQQLAMQNSSEHSSLSVETTMDAHYTPSDTTLLLRVTVGNNERVGCYIAKSEMTKTDLKIVYFMNDL